MNSLRRLSSGVGMISVLRNSQHSKRSSQIELISSEVFLWGSTTELSSKQRRLRKHKRRHHQRIRARRLRMS